MWGVDSHTGCYCTFPWLQFEGSLRWRLGWGDEVTPSCDITGSHSQNTNKSTNNSEKLSQMFFRLLEKQWGQHSLSHQKDIIIFNLKVSGFNAGQTNVIFFWHTWWPQRLYITSWTYLKVLHHCFASLMSPPVTGMDELIADTSLSYISVFFSFFFAEITNKQHHCHTFTTKTEQQNITVFVFWVEWINPLLI